MDNLFEILIPLIFFAVYFISQIFGKKSNPEEETREQESSMPEEMKRIREDLRRKIEDRKSGNQGTARGAPAEAREAQTAHGGSVLRESHTPHRLEDRREAAGELRRRSSQSRPPTPSDQAPAQDANQWERELEEKMQEVQRTRERADSLREETRKKTGEIGARSSAQRKHDRSRGTGKYRQFLRESLGNPESLRRSFILHEVFGTPVGARRKGETRPSWEI